MKILFVCRSNVGRSQMAEILFNKNSKNHKAISAGTHAEKNAGKKLPELSKDITQLMKEEGYDVSNKFSKQLTKEMVDEVDKVIMINTKENWPDYLKNSPKVIFWDVPDPQGTTIDFKRKIKNQIKILVENLVKEIE